MPRNRFFIPLLAASAALAAGRPAVALEELHPRHVTPEIRTAVRNGLGYLARTQNSDGSWRSTKDGGAYPISMASLAGMAFLANGNTQSRGSYADHVRAALGYVMRFGQDNGLITGPTQEQGRPMYGHGFSMMFMSCCYGTENNVRIRRQLRKTITAAIELTGQAQSPAGGWTYVPGAGDEGSVTITQIQALRAAHLAGFTVPEGTIRNAIRYLELCRAPEGGIRYSLSSGGNSRLAISAAAVATLYNAGDYDSEMADQCLKYVFDTFQSRKNQWSKGGGHDFYAHHYASQAFYQAGNKYWDPYYPAAAAQLVGMAQGDGSWRGGVGPVYGTSLALVVLQLPYKYLPIYQR